MLGSTISLEELEIASSVQKGQELSESVGVMLRNMSISVMLSKYHRPYHSIRHEARPLFICLIIYLSKQNTLRAKEGIYIRGGGGGD